MSIHEHSLEVIDGIQGGKMMERLTVLEIAWLEQQNAVGKKAIVELRALRDACDVADEYVVKLRADRAALRKENERLLSNDAGRADELGRLRNENKVLRLDNKALRVSFHDSFDAQAVLLRARNLLPARVVDVEMLEGIIMSYRCKYSDNIHGQPIYLWRMFHSNHEQTAEKELQFLVQFITEHAIDTRPDAQAAERGKG